MIEDRLTKQSQTRMSYIPGMFDEFKNENNFERWTHFPDLLWGLGYEMDCRHSFEEYQRQSKIELPPQSSKREIRKNTLLLLERADRQIVGNFLFSEWRYYTHWTMPGECDEFITDYLQRIIVILESKYDGSTNE
jgi:hypothetical protein